MNYFYPKESCILMPLWLSGYSLRTLSVEVLILWGHIHEGYWYVDNIIPLYLSDSLIAGERWRINNLRTRSLDLTNRFISLLSLPRTQTRIKPSFTALFTTTLHRENIIFVYINVCEKPQCIHKWHPFIYKCTMLLHIMQSRLSRKCRISRFSYIYFQIVKANKYSTLFFPLLIPVSMFKENIYNWNCRVYHPLWCMFERKFSHNSVKM